MRALRVRARATGDGRALACTTTSWCESKRGMVASWTGVAWVKPWLESADTTAGLSAGVSAEKAEVDALGESMERRRSHAPEWRYHVPKPTALLSVGYHRCRLSPTERDTQQTPEHHRQAQDETSTNDH